MLLYERFLGRPFAGHRDSVSELIGDILELAIETELTNAGISFRKTRRAERVLVELAAREALNPDAVRFVNRLSDFFFLAARRANDNGARDVLWVPGQNR